MNLLNRSVLTLKILLTLLVMVVLYHGLILAFHVSAMLSSPASPHDVEIPSAVAPFDIVNQEREQMRARFPLPLYPGAQNPEFGELSVMGRPVYRCDFDVHAAPGQILEYYRAQLRMRGWTDNLQAMMRDTSYAQSIENPAIDVLQSEPILRYLDHMMETQATFTRPGYYAMIAVEEGRFPIATRVGVQVIGFESPEAFARALTHTVTPGERELDAFSPPDFAQSGGGLNNETRIRTYRELPHSVAARIIHEYETAGWHHLPLPQESQEFGNSAHAIMSRGEDILVLHVIYDETTDYSRAMLTMMGSP